MQVRTVGKAENLYLSGPQQVAMLRKLRQNAAAYVLDMSVRRLRDHMAPRNDDGTYSAQELVRWWVARREDSMRDRQQVDSELAGEDAEIFGAGAGNSPWLERCRREKARELGRKNKVAEGALMETAVISMQLAEIGQAFRKRAEAIERVHGPDVGRAIRDMVDEAQEAWEKMIPAPAPALPEPPVQAKLEFEPEAPARPRPEAPARRKKRAKKRGKKEGKKKPAAKKPVPGKRKAIESGYKPREGGRWDIGR